MNLDNKMGHEKPSQKMESLAEPITTFGPQPSQPDRWERTGVAIGTLLAVAFLAVVVPPVVHVLLNIMQWSWGLVG